MFAHDPEAARHFPAMLTEIRSLHEARRAVALYRSHPRSSSRRLISPRWCVKSSLRERDQERTRASGKPFMESPPLVEHLSSLRC
jgi:hypothetical protein